MMAEPETSGRRRGLGMGLSALLGNDADLARSDARPVPAKIVPIERLYPSPIQPRKQFGDDELDSLADSLRRHGLLQPLLVRTKDDGRYEIVAGERRWRAAQRAGLHEVTVVIKQLDDRDLLEMALIENLQREDLSPFEEAEAFRQLCNRHGYSHEQVAEAIGKSRPHVANSIRLLSLPDEVRQLIENRLLTAGHGRALLSAPDPVGLAKRAAETQMNVRQVEQAAKQGASSSPMLKVVPRPDPNIASLESELAQNLGLGVQIKPKRKGGSITIRYGDHEQLDGLLNRLRSSS